MTCFASLCLVLLFSTMMVSAAAEQNSNNEQSLLRGLTFRKRSRIKSTRKDIYKKRLNEFVKCTLKHDAKCSKCKRRPPRSSCKAFKHWYKKNLNCCDSNKCSAQLTALKACKVCWNATPTLRRTPKPTPIYRGKVSRRVVCESATQCTSSPTLLLCILLGLSTDSKADPS